MSMAEGYVRDVRARPWPEDESLKQIELQTCALATGIHHIGFAFCWKAHLVEMGHPVMARPLAWAICWVFVTQLFVDVTSACDPRDRAALLAFKAETFDSLGTLESWVESGDCCNFYAVSCNSKGRVVNLTIVIPELGEDCDGVYDICFVLQRTDNSSTHNLLGRTISKLSALEVLSLKNVLFFESLPTGLGNLKNLKVLRLEEALFSGPLPPDFANFTSLTELSLRVNDLNGPLPPFLCNLQNLVSIDLSHTSFSGSLPACIGRLRQLKHLQLAYSSLTGRLPASLSALRELQELNVTGNHFSGPLPRLPKFPSLRLLGLDGNKFVGTIPPHYGSLSSLVDLRLGGLNVSADFANEAEVVLYSELEGTIPQQLGALKKLQVLHIRASNIHGVIPQSFSNLVNLVDLELDRNHLSGPVPDFSKLPKLQTLELEDNLF